MWLPPLLLQAAWTPLPALHLTLLLLPPLLEGRAPGRRVLLLGLCWWCGQAPW
jgi:hypothetical protein